MILLEKILISDSKDYFELKIQIASSKKNLPLKSYNFKGLSDLSIDKIDNTYKYFFGKTNDYGSAKKLLSKAKKTGYKDSKIVAFKNGVRISLNEFLTSI